MMRYYTPEDDIYFFGFSRGAYTARFLAEMLDHVGLLSAGNEELTRFAWKTFSKWQARRGGDSREDKDKEKEMYEFMRNFRETFSRPVKRIRRSSCQSCTKGTLSNRKQGSLVFSIRSTVLPALNRERSPCLPTCLRGMPAVSDTCLHILVTEPGCSEANFRIPLIQVRRSYGMLYPLTNDVPSSGKILYPLPRTQNLPNKSAIPGRWNRHTIKLPTTLRRETHLRQCHRSVWGKQMKTGHHGKCARGQFPSHFHFLEVRVHVVLIHMLQLEAFESEIWRHSWTAVPHGVRISR